MVEEAPVLASTGRPLTPGDILVLVRSRGELASLIVARLFSEGVPVAGVDRLHLHEPLAVQDLLAAVQFAVQPLDDLNLACLLVSPLIGWDQEQLRELASAGEGSALARAARAGRRVRDSRQPTSAVGAAEDGRLHHAAAFPRDHPFRPARGPAQAVLPAWHGGARSDRRAAVSALEFERNETASLDRFLAWFSRGTVEVQRDPGGRPTRSG